MKKNENYEEPPDWNKNGDNLKIYMCIAAGYLIGIVAGYIICKLLK